MPDRKQTDRDLAVALAPWVAQGLSDHRWAKLAPGPSVGEVAERISTAPQPFLAEDLDLVALAGDVLPDDVAALDAAGRIASADREGAVTGGALCLWLLASTDLIGPFSVPLAPTRPELPLLALGLRLAPVVHPQRWLAEDQRRDEAARLFLLWSGHLPAGEGAEHAKAMWTMRDSVVRALALAKASADAEHRRRVAQEIANARAREAAARTTRE